MVVRRRWIEQARARLDMWLHGHTLLVTVLTVTLVAGVGYLRLEHIVDDIIAAREDGRRVSCQDSNEITERINTLLTLTAMPKEGQARTAEVQAQVDAFLDKYLVTPRVCTPDAIADHLSGKEQP